MKSYEDFTHEQRELSLTIANTRELYDRGQEIVNMVMKKDIVLFDVLFSSSTFKTFARFCHQYYNKRYGSLPLSVTDREDVVKSYLYDEITERM